MNVTVVTVTSVEKLYSVYKFRSIRANKPQKEECDGVCVENANIDSPLCVTTRIRIANISKGEKQDKAKERFKNPNVTKIRMSDKLTLCFGFFSTKKQNGVFRSKTQNVCLARVCHCHHHVKAFYLT